jgi:hypothetical protein
MRNLLQKESISKLCDELGPQPAAFCRWHKEFFENGAVAFQVKGRTDQQAEKERVGKTRWRATATHVHDAGRRHRGRAGSRVAEEMQRQAVEERDWLRAEIETAMLAGSFAAGRSDLVHPVHLVQVILHVEIARESFTPRTALEANGVLVGHAPAESDQVVAFLFSR